MRGIQGLPIFKWGERFQDDIVTYKSHIDKAGTELKSKFFQVQTQDIFH